MSKSPLHSPAFPAIDLVPKKETETLEFLQQYPDYDGRNVVIGILDTGIDPGAAGIRYMQDGKTPKLIDLVDCTGSGDVDISCKAQVTLCDDGDDDCYQILGLSGRQWKLRKDWWMEQDSLDDDKLPTVQLGIKRAYELFPNSLVTRVKAHRHQQLEQALSGEVAKVRQQLNDWKRAHNSNDKKRKATYDQLRDKDNLQALLDVLMDQKDLEEDPGLILDCIVFDDGEDMRAVILSDADVGKDYPSYILPMASFSKEFQYGTISTLDQYNYGVNFYDDHQILSIVGDCTPHGTHVASIAAAAEGDRSGVAPGAQLVSIKIGDSRMGSMESGSSVARGIMAAVKLGCDVINLSYGEAGQLANEGRVARLAEEVVWRHNIMFVSAVGNNGPALTTLNAPGGITTCIMGVAAYVSPNMMKAEYSLFSNTTKTGDDVSDLDENDEDDPEALVGTSYTWSSVGPTVDGANGVSVCAPGGAIASVSNWTMQKSMLMNGTSMASPHACGCVALLVSACKAEGIPVSPARIQRAIENTARFMPNLTNLQQGWGMVQVSQAFQQLVAVKDIPNEDVYFEVNVENLPSNPRGIYLRQKEDVSAKRVFTIRINPHFRRVKDVDATSQRSQIDFEMQFNLFSTASWLKVPRHFMCMNNGRNFKVAVNPLNLEPGVHTARVCGSDAEHPERGFLWSCPVTVVKPLPEEPTVELPSLEFEATEVKRFFVVPPPGSTWMDITIKDCRSAKKDGDGSTKLYVLHTVQLLPHTAYRESSSQKYLNLLPSQTSICSTSVEAGVTCEVDIGRYWATSGISKADVTIDFRGVRPDPSELCLRAGDSFKLVQAYSDLRDEIISPTAKLSSWKTALRPKQEGTITPLGERDVQPWNEKKTYQLLLHYEFTQDEKGSFTPRAPALQGVLYESTYESQLILAYDGEKRYLGFCDAYPSAISTPKGLVVLKMQIRHDDPTMLEKLIDMTLWIDRKLDKEIAVSCYSTREDVLVGGKRSMKKRTLRNGTCASVFFAEPPSSKLPSCKEGDVLMGTAYFCSGDSTLPGDGKRPGGFPVSYTVGPKMDRQSSETEAAVEQKDERSPDERLAEAIRDLKVDQLSKLTSAEKERGLFETTFKELLKEYPTYIPLLLTNLKYLDSSKNRSEILPKILQAADGVIENVAEDELAMHFGKRLDKEDSKKVQRNKDLEKKRAQLIEAIVRKSIALMDQKEQDDAPQLFKESLSKLKEWMDIDSNVKYAVLALERDGRSGRLGLVLKRLNKLISKNNGKDTGGARPLTKTDLLRMRCDVLKELGYTALAEREESMRLITKPRDYKLF